MVKARKSKVIAYIVLSILALLFVLPVAWVLLASFDTNASQAIAWPTEWTVQNYVSAITSPDNLRAFGNGLILALGQSALVVVCAGLAAYPLSRYEMRHKQLFMLTMLFMTSLPATVLIIPAYKMFVTLHLHDSLFGIILFSSASSMPYAIWMMKNFMDSVPVDIEEAAWADGASTLQGIWHIIVPLMLPGIFTIAIYTFSNSWGNFLTPFILLTSADKMPASVRLYQYFGQHTIRYSDLAAFSVLYALPAVILYIIAQKYMSKGFSMQGAAKG